MDRIETIAAAKRCINAVLNSTNDDLAKSLLQRVIVDIDAYILLEIIRNNYSESNKDRMTDMELQGEIDCKAGIPPSGDDEYYLRGYYRQDLEQKGIYHFSDDSKNDRPF